MVLPLKQLRQLKPVSVVMLTMSMLLALPLVGAESLWLNPMKYTPKEEPLVTPPIKEVGTFQDAARQFFALKGVLKPNATFPNTVTRAEWATLLDAAMGPQAGYYNDAGFYPDVPANYWAFESIEDLRLKGIAPFEVVDNTGHFAPDETITIGQAMLWLSRSLKLIPSQQRAEATAEQNQQLLAVYGVDPLLAQNKQEAIATLLSAGFSGFLLDASGHLRDLSAPLEGPSAIALAYRRNRMQEQAQFTYEVVEKRLPSGVGLTLNPTEVLFWPQVQVGQQQFFVLRHPLISEGIYVPASSRVAGVVSQVQIGSDTQPKEATVLLKQLLLPNGQWLKLTGQLLLIRDKQMAITPEQQFEVTTQ